MSISPALRKIMLNPQGARHIVLPPSSRIRLRYAPSGIGRVKGDNFLFHFGGSIESHTLMRYPTFVSLAVIALYIAVPPSQRVDMTSLACKYDVSTTFPHLLHMICSFIKDVPVSGKELQSMR